MRTYRSLLVIPLLALALWPLCTAQGVVVQRVSVTATGGQGDGPSERPAISATGRFVAFSSKASNLVPGDVNGCGDIFVYDRETGELRCASRSWEGKAANGTSRNCAMSPDGRFVAFDSDASNLVLGDTNGVSDVFIHDFQSGRTERVSVPNAGQGLEADGPSYAPAMSADGTFVAFISRATNLADTTTPGVTQVFLRDRLNGTTTLISRSTGGVPGNGNSQHPCVSSDGRYVAYDSEASNLVYDRNGCSDVFIFDRFTQVTEPVSVSVLGELGNGASFGPSLGGYGRYVAFSTFATNLTTGPREWYLLYPSYAQVLVRDRQWNLQVGVTLTPEYGSERGAQIGMGNSLDPSISEDGRYVAYSSDAWNIEDMVSWITGDSNGVTDIFIHDRQRNALQLNALISTGPAPLGTSARAPATNPDVSSDGQFIAFQCASPLLPDDTNGMVDVYVADINQGPPEQPTNLVAENTDENQITITWRDNSSNEDYFEIYGRDTYLSEWHLVGLALPNSTSFVDEPVWAGVEYEYQVRAVNSDQGNDGLPLLSLPSDTVAIQPYGWRCEHVSWQVDYGNNWTASGWVIKPGASQLRLHFSSIDTEEGRDFLTTNAGDTWTGQFSDQTSSVRQGHVIDLTLWSNAYFPGSFRIDRVEFKGISEGPATYGGSLFANVSNELWVAPPTQLRATTVNARTVDLTWTDNATNDIAYEVERRVGWGDYERIAQLPANSTSYRDSAAVPGERLTYRVRAIGLSGASEYSNEAWVVTLLGGYGELATIGEGEDTVTVLYAGGTPYQIGFWHGLLLRDQVQACLSYALTIAEMEVPRFVLLEAWNAMLPYVAPEYLQELQGLSDGSGVPIEDLYAMHALPDLAEYHCSAFAAFGPATADGHMIQLRNLDFSMDLGIQDYPLIIVGEPLDGPRYANVTFAGFIGSIAGMNAAGIGVSEVGESYDYENEKLSGTPMPFVLRRVIAHATSLADAVNIIEEAEGTSSYIFVVGDARTPDAAVFMYSGSIFQYWGPGGVADIDSEPGLPNIVYHGMYNDRLYADLAAAWGTITPQVAMQISEHNAMISSNLMNTLYDLTTGDLWVNYAEGPNGRAANQPFVHLNILEHQTPPLVTAVTPAPGAVGAAPNSAVTVAFSKPLDPASVTSDTVQVLSEGGPVASALSYDAASRTVTLSPLGLLEPGQYTLTVAGGAGGVRGTTGLPLPQDHVSSFQVADTMPPVLSIVAPQPGATVKGVVGIEVQAQDPDGRVASVEIAIGQRTWSLSSPPYRVQWDTRPLSVSEGTQTIVARAYDQAGHVVTRNADIRVDNTTFDDVPKTSTQWPYVEAVVREGITSGCAANPPLYCPGGPVTRSQMAVFLCRAAGLEPYQNPVPTFSDVPPTDPRYGYVEALHRARITTGCSTQPMRFCPASAVSRGQMAVFLCRAAGLAPVSPPQATFGDVPVGHPQFGYVEALVASGIAAGCQTQPPAFCPNTTVTRGQMALFLCRAFAIAAGP